MAKRYRARRVRKPAASVNGSGPVLLVEANCNQICLPCPRCGADLTCLDISFIDIRDKHAAELRARIGLRLPVYPQQYPTCGCAITYDDAESGFKD